MIVRVDAGRVNFTEVYTLNSTAAALWKWVQGREFTSADLTDYLCEHYEVNCEVAQQDVERLLVEWKNFGLLTNS